MSISVSSWFLAQAGAAVSEPRRVFSIGGSDYSQAVLRWPRLTFKSNAVFLGTAAVTLSNCGGAFNFFVNCGLSLTTSCEFSLGFQTPQGGEERISLFRGEPNAVSVEDWGATVRLNLQGKTKRLTDAKMGSDTESGGLDFTGSAYYPADLAWTLVTCYGEMSPLASDANPDIHFPQWQTWRNLNEIRAVKVSAYFTGEKVYQALDALAEMDSMALAVRDGKLYFSPIVTEFTEPARHFVRDEVLAVTVSVDPARVVNDFSVEGDYHPPTRTFRGLATQANSFSQAIYGKKSGRFGSRSVWFASGNDGGYLAEDQVRFGHEPVPQLHLKTTLAGGVYLSVGDVVTVSDSVFPLGESPLRITEMAVDLAGGTMEFRMEKARRKAWQYQSTVSTENLLVETITRLDGGDWLALDESFFAGRVFRRPGSGEFEPLGGNATALLPLGEGQVLFGGPASGGSPHSVVRRSADGGLTSVTVSSLDPFLPAVQEIFEVRSGTYLASTSSGGIWRSTDGGSSWAHTSTISGAYHLKRFFQPDSGRVWGGTGIDTLLLGQGVHIWESLDEGVSWAPHHTVTPSGDAHVQGFFAIPGGEALLSTYGTTIGDLNVYRSRATSPDSVSWTLVLSGAGFSHVVRTESDHLVFGFQEPITLAGGGTYRSLDLGSSWLADARVSKQGNIRILDNGDGTLDAYSARITAGVRTDHYRNFDPNQLG